MKRNKALLTLFYSLLSIVIMSFFLLLTTYTKAPNNINDNDNIEVIINDYKEDLNKSIKESYILNNIELNIKEDFINALLLSYKKNDYFIKSEYWTLNHVKLSFEENQIIGNFYLDYHNKINYSLKLKAYLSLESSDDTYILKLDRVKCGIYTIPSFILNSIIKKDKEDTLGYIIKNSVTLLPFGVLNLDSMSLIIAKNELISAIKSQFILDRLKINYTEASLISFYINVLFSSDNLSIKLTDSVDVFISYSNIINDKKLISYEYTDLSELKEVVEDIKISNIINTIFNVDNTVSADINKVILYDITKDNTYSDSLLSPILSDISLVKDGSKYSFSVIYSIDLMYSKITFHLDQTSDNLFKINKIDIGKDVLEERQSYIEYTNEFDIMKALFIFEQLGINVDAPNMLIDLDSYYKSYNYDINSMSFDYGESNDKIINDLLNNHNDFNFKEYKNKIDFSSRNAILNTLLELNNEEKRDFLYRTRDYYLLKDNIVYNYIIELINKMED